MSSPARGYSWEPFKPGNSVAERHGAYSPRKVDPLASEHVDRVLVQAAEDGSPVAYLLDRSYRPALWAWARTEARIQLVWDWLLERGGELDGDGEALGAANLLNRLEARAENLRSRLGLDPLSRARLGRDVAAGQVDVARLMAQLAEAAAEESDDDGP